MTLEQLSQAKDKDLPASLVAIRRAGLLARETTLRTNTAIVVLRERTAVRITADELRKAVVR